MKIGLTRLSLALAVVFCATVASAGISVDFKDIRPFHQAPYEVRYAFRAVLSDGPTVNDWLDSDFVTWKIYEGGEQIDPQETSYFVTPGERLPLRMAVVLDFTGSMNSAGAIDEMRAAVVDHLIGSEAFTDAHQMAILAYFDRPGGHGGGKTVLSEPWAYLSSPQKQELAQVVQDYQPPYCGASQIWDTLQEALLMFDQDALPGESRCVVFFTDGRDTSSTSTPAELIDAAQTRDVRLFPFGFGEDVDNGALEGLAEDTGGEYFSATGASGLANALATLSHNLGGFWALTYITLRSQGEYEVEAKCEFESIRAAFRSSFRADLLDGNMWAGLLRLVDDPAQIAYDEALNESRVRLRAEYIPRDIQAFRFVLSGPVKRLELLEGGGICSRDDWRIDELGGGVFDLTNRQGEPLDYGQFGEMLDIVVGGQQEDFYITLQCDNSIYSLGQTLEVSPYTAGNSSEHFYVNVRTDKLTYRPGDTLQVEITARNTGEDSLVNAYLGLLTPYGVWCFTDQGWSTAASPALAGFLFGSGVSIGPAYVLSIPVPSLEPPIEEPAEYAFVLALQDPEFENFTAVDYGSFIYGNAPEGFAYIPAGEFLMGSPESEEGHSDNESPQHQVSISRALFVQATEVTQQQWEDVMVTNPSSFQKATRPVENVNWHDCVEYCNLLSEREWLSPCYEFDGDKTVCHFDANGYRLPTEAEWEYFCRAGTETRFWTGDSEPGLERAAWFEDNAGEKTFSVSQKEPNTWGLYDIHGNVAEWCWDWHDGEYYAGRPDPDIDPTGPATGTMRVVRGGSYRDSADECRSAQRSKSPTNTALSSIGFRVVRLAQ